MDPDQLISIHTVSVSKNGIYLGSAGQGLIWYLHKCFFYYIVTYLSWQASISILLCLLEFFYIFVICCLFFKINLLYSSPRVKQIELRSGPIFCWSWSGSKTACKGYQQTTIAGKQCISNQLAGFHLLVCIFKQSRKQFTSWSAGFRIRLIRIYTVFQTGYPRYSMVWAKWFTLFYIIYWSSYFCNFIFVNFLHIKFDKNTSGEEI